MSAVTIELPAERYWALPEARRNALGLLPEAYASAVIFPPALLGASEGAAWALTVHAGDEAAMRGVVAAVAAGTVAQYSADDLRAMLRAWAR